MTGVAVGSLLPIAYGWWALHARKRPALPPGHRRAVLTELAHNSHALIAFLALTNIDVLVARSTLPAHPAGLYAGGLILVKAVLFLPQFVIVLAFPALASGGSSQAGQHGSAADAPGGAPDTAGRPDTAGKPDTVVTPDSAGRPDTAGQPDDAGRPDTAEKPDDAGEPAIPGDESPN